MRGHAEDEWVHLLKPDHGSHSGLIHLRNVERDADKLIPLPLKECFSDGEIFVLLASVLLHDLGRILPDRERSTDPNEPEFCLLAQSPGTPCNDKRRNVKEQKTHACRSCYLIREQWPHFGLPDEQVAQLCAVVTFCHQLDGRPDPNSECYGQQACAHDFANTSLEPYGPIRVPLLAAVLRIADETEDSWTRAVRQHWYEHFKSRPNEMYKAFRRDVADVEFRPDAECIVMHLHGLRLGNMAPASDDSRTELLKSLRDRVIATREALYGWRGYLDQAGIRYRHVFVQQENQLFLEPPESLSANLPGLDEARKQLQNTLETPIDKQQPYLLAGTVSRYLRQIGKLVLQR